MPSSTSQQNNYYASHHRRGSQLSLLSNGEQSEGARPLQSPNRSLVFLPASTYTMPSRSQEDNPMTSTSPPPQNGSLMRSQLDGHGSPMRQSPDPRFWTQNRQNSFSEGFGGTQTGASLQKVRSNGQSSVGSTSQRDSAEASRSTPTLNTNIRQRTASIKELVAKFDSPIDQIPPVPSRTGSRVASRATSPTPASTLTDFLSQPASASEVWNGSTDQYSTWSGRRARTPAGTRTSNMHTVDLMPSIPSPQISQHPIINTLDFDPYRKPLFGEIVPQASSFVAGPGYGISSPRRRRASEASPSPMRSPNPMFSPSADSDFASPISPTDWYRDAKVEAPLHSSAITSHRRAQSDLTNMSENRSLLQGEAGRISKLPQPISKRNPQNPSITKGTSQSRIPVHRSQNSTASNSTTSPPSSRAPSTQDRYPKTGDNSQRIPRVVAPPTPKSSTPKRRPITPTLATPQGRGSQTTHLQSDKSPSLRANIIVPPPKISPPLRSSRPRQPVSAASTAASRAKMAEKFEKAQRTNSDRRTSARSRTTPKELKNIDFEMRRKNITEALDRLHQSSFSESPIDREGRDTPIAGFSRTPASAETIERATLAPEVIVVDETNHELDIGNRDSDLTPEAGMTPMPGGFPDDSPPQVNTELRPLRVDVEIHPDVQQSGVPGSSISYLQPSVFGPEESVPNSAITVATDATIFDTEPQAPFTRPKSPHRTVLSQVMGMREASPLTPSSASCSESGLDVSDHADEESVQIMLRNTRYMEDSPTLPEAFQDGPLGQEPALETPDMQSHERSSWTSSIPDDFSDDERLEAIQEASPDPQRQHASREILMSPDHRRPGSAIRRRDVEPLDSLRSTMASDAYTVVDFVLQQNLNSQVVSSNMVDEVAQRVLQQSPRHLYQQTFDRDRVEELTLQQLSNDRYNPNEDQVSQLESSERPHDAGPRNQYDSRPSSIRYSHHFVIHSEGSLDLSGHQEISQSMPSQPTHQYDSSRGSEMDWVTPYPDSHEQHRQEEDPRADNEDDRQLPEEVLTARASTFPLSKSYTEPDYIGDDSDSTRGLGLSMRVTSPVSLPWDGYVPARPPSHSPPPPPLPVTQSFEDVTRRFTPVESAVLTPRGLPPQIPRRITSQSQMSQHRSRAASAAPSISSATIAESRQSSEQQPGTEDEKMLSDAQKKLKQRRHIIKELVDTEQIFERDMKVVVDIYLATAEPIASKPDLAIIFANSEEVVQFSRNFGTKLKSTAKPVYDKSRTGRSSSAQPSLNRSSSYGSTLDGDRDTSESDRDRQTRIGEVFLSSAAEMESVYKVYMMKQDGANKKVQVVLQTDKGRLWTQMCHNESRDLTSAWDLPSLLVKPVQRAMKYKLFLGDLLRCTPSDHPDYNSLKRACDVVDGMMSRINEAKKHTELFEQAMGRKRKDSGAGKGFNLTKINRGTEKLKQNMGLAEAYEDIEYTRIFQDYDERLVYFHTVIEFDQEQYRSSLTAWIDKLCRIAELCDIWVEVQPTKHTEMESKLRHFSQAARSIRRVGIEPHLRQINREVFDPIRTAHELLSSFKVDPKGLLVRREKKLVDYARLRNERDRNGKLDKKATEKVEQWEALNREAKSRMAQLIKLSWEVTVSSYRRFAPIHVPWFEMITRNLAEAMSLNETDLRVPELERDFKSDFGPLESAVLNLRICNGALAKELSNMVSANGNDSDSPRQQSTWSGANKRSISLHSEGSQDPGKRGSGTFHPSPLIKNGSDQNLPFNYGRVRASSVASGQPRTPTFGSMMSPQSAHSPQLRPGTSPGLSSTDLPSFAPRVSLDAPSPYINLESPIARPESGSTFYSASGAQGNHAAPGDGGGGDVAGSSIFSSAMPMSDSPISTRGPSFEQEAAHNHHNANSPVLFTVASIYEFNIDRARSEAGWPYLTYTSGEIFDVIGEKGELWLSRNQDQPEIVGWIWNKHFMKLAV